MIFTDLNVLVLAQRDLGISGALRERQSVVLVHRRIVTGSNGLVQIDVGNFIYTVGQSFQIVTNEDLPVQVQIHLAAYLLQQIVLFAVHPERGIVIHHGIISVQTDVLGEVAQFLLFRHLISDHIPTAVIGGNVIGVYTTDRFLHTC